MAETINLPQISNYPHIYFSMKNSIQKFFNLFINFKQIGQRYKGTTLTTQNKFFPMKKS